MSPRQVWISSPRRTAPELLERTSIFDEGLVGRLLDRVAESAASPNKHYTVLVGEAGAGKSHLLALLCHRIAQIDREDLAVAWLPDDAGGWLTEAHLFEAILAALGAAGEAPPDRDRVAAATVARERLRQVLAGRTLLLCIEDLDQVLANLGEAGQRGLRGFLQEERCCAVLATARRLSRDFTDQGRPFFGFFGVYRIDPMDGATTGQLLVALARARGDEALAVALASDRHRPTVLALHHLLGGRPARYVDLVRRLDELDDPACLVLRALDEHARWQRLRREQLSPQQRLILHWLTGRVGAAQVKQVAQACAISEQTVSPQLRALRAAGWVSSTRVGRETWYEVRDPLTGIDSDYARALFAFARQWFGDPEQAMQQHTAIADRIRSAAAAADDPRPALAVPQLERRFAADWCSAVQGGSAAS